MTSFELDFVDEKSRAGAEFMEQISRELQRAFLTEKKARKITQQAIANTVGTSRAVINRELQGLENIGARRIGELFWAMGWRPKFTAERIPDGENEKPAPVLEVGIPEMPDAANQNLLFDVKIHRSAAAG